ncbi:MAG: TetR/AcrR family transcriptional regulator [Sphaerochaetaceae bacterium]
MPKGFSEIEKDKINKALLETGIKLFSQYGIKKTSVADITQAVGISQGSFYNFYLSKEALFFAVLEMEETRIRKELVLEDGFSSSNTRENIKRLMQWALRIIEEHPLIRQLYQKNEMELLFRKLPQEDVTKHLMSDTDFMLPLIMKWQDNGLITDKKPEVIVGLLRTVLLLPFNKDIIGETVYQQTTDMLIEYVAEGLCKGASET